ncbi:MAG: hypothetical protein JNK67_17020 [Alphaproteobacteria bacterium]|nr:hypothetical protein [Alphaproteobacteria bacterium]
MFKHDIAKILSTAALVAMFGVASADAATITFDFQNSGGTTSGSGYGNVRTYEASGLTVTVTSWGVTGAGNTQFQTAQTGYFSGNGLGVCTRAEGTGCSSPEHQVDNSGAREYVLFKFSQAIDPTQVAIDPYGAYDRDVEYFVGNATSTILTGLAPSAASLGTVGLGTRFTSLSTASESGRIVAIDGGTVNALLFGVGPLNSSGFDNIVDRFKIEWMTVQTSGPSGAPDPVGTPVPAPASLALLGGALLGLRLIGRRKA